MVREPRGVVPILMPWCDPIAATAGALAAALVSGNTVVLKPSEKAPLAAQRVVELLDLGDIIGVAGYLFRTRTGELSVHV